MQGLDLPRTKPGLPMTPPLPEISSQPTTVRAITSQTLPDQVKSRLSLKKLRTMYFRIYLEESMGQGQDSGSEPVPQ